MKIVCISDTHMHHDVIKVPKGDLLIHAGDALSYGSQAEFEKFALWFRLQPHPRKIYVPGNHDKFVETHFAEAQQLLGDGVDLLRHSGVYIDGLYCWGCPGTLAPWSFQMDERQLALAAEAIPDDTNIVISHVPAYGTLNSWQWRGSGPLHTRLKSLEPPLHVHGHIHEQYGVAPSASRRGISVNAAICNFRYEPVNAPIVVRL